MLWLVVILDTNLIDSISREIINFVLKFLNRILFLIAKSLEMKLPDLSLMQLYVVKIQKCSFYQHSFFRILVELIRGQESHTLLLG